MPLRDDILNPISEASPGGDSLRYAPVYDKIKEARRADDDAARGELQIELKLADYPLVIKLASEAIATKSKDLQLAAWLTEALLKRDGYQGLRDGLGLIKALVENFWDSLWPEIDDGDVEMRTAPIDWVGQYLVIPTKQVAVNKAGHDYLKYLEAKAVGREPGEDASETKRQQWDEAVAEGKLNLDDFDKSVAVTPKSFYETQLETIDACLEIIEESQPLFEEKFTPEYAPSYAKLKDTLEEVRRLYNILLKQKIEAEGPRPEAEPEPAEEETSDDSSSYSYGEEEQTETVVVRKPKGRKITSAEPVDLEDAADRVAAVAAFWRVQDPYSPAPYLMLRGMRWGEVRAGDALDPNTFDPPPTETRTGLKRLMADGSYAEAIELAESAMAQPCGRAWLDLQRYVVTACENMGYTAIAAAIRSELKALILDRPDLLTSTMMDDTPCANPETVRWCEEFCKAPEPVAEAPAPVWYEAPQEEEEEASQSTDAEKEPDSFDLAQEAARNGRVEEAMDILAGEIARQTSGRGRFQRKLQLAQICLASGHSDIARAVLTEMAAAIDRHELESWESADLVAHALSLLYSCSDMEPQGKAQLYARICRLSPVAALRHGAHGR